MNLTMQHPVSYPFYMDSPRLRFALPWPVNPFQYSSPHPQQYYSSSYQLAPPLAPISYPLPFVISHPSARPNPPAKPAQSYSSYTNTRYNHLKQSTSHMNRHRSVDASLHSQQYFISNHQYQPPKTKSISDFHHVSNQSSARLLKAHSWHSMNHLNQPNANINYAKEMPVVHEKHCSHLYSPPLNRKLPPNSLLLSPSPIIKNEIPEPGLVRISTLDEMPIIQNPIYKANITKFDNTDKSDKKAHYKKSSSTSTCSSHSSFQKLLNGTLRHDPLLTAAMEDFRQLHRTSSQSTPLMAHNRDLSRDSLCSDSICHSSSSSSTSTSSSSIPQHHSHSSFTSLERLEIRNLIKTLKKNGLQSLSIPIQQNSFCSLPITEQLIEQCSLPITQSNNKPEKSSITEELEREFNKLRSSNPNQELIYVKPSLISKQKKTCSSLTRSDKYLQKNSKQIDDTTITTTILKQTNEKEIFSVPISQSTPKQLSEELIKEREESETKPEYAVPIKMTPDVSLREMKKDEQMRSFSFCKPIHDIDREICQTRPLSMFNWLNCGLTNQLPSTFQPNKIKNNEYEDENDKALVKENIYASDIDVHVPLANDKEYLNNPSIMTDYLSDCKQQKHNSSIFTDFSRLFTRFGNNKHEHKSKSKRKLHKNNNQHNSRCSIM